MDFSCRKDALEQSGIHALCSQSNKGETEIFVALCLPKRVRGRFRVLIRLRSTYYDFATTDYRVSHFVQLTGCCLNGGSVQPSLIVKLRQGSGKDWQGMAVKAKGLKA